MRERDVKVSRFKFIFRCHDKTDMQMYNAHSLWRLTDRRIGLPNPLLPS